jgi:hypothetical protein
MKYSVLNEYKKMTEFALELIIEMAHKCAADCEVPSKDYHRYCEIEMYADIALKSKYRRI